MKPDFLGDNPTIYIVAPSFGCTTKPYNLRLVKSIQNFKNLNANVIIGDNVYKSEGLAASNTPEKRAKEIMDAYNSDANVIISAGGGEVMSQILEYIDFDVIKKNPKWFVGFSDNTNLTYTITTNCDIETIYGTNAAGYYSMLYDSLDTWLMLNGKNEFYGYKKWQYEKKDNKPLSGYNLDKKSRIYKYNYDKPFNGRLIGGCLDCLQGLCGTSFDKTKEYLERHKDEGIIFFLEACDFNSVGIIRALTQLKNAGWFKYLKGFIIGRSMHYYDKSFNITPKDAYLSVLKDFNVPILLDIDLGHLGPSMPIRCGAKATIEYKKNTICIRYDE